MKTKLHAYHFNCGDLSQSQAYLKLRDERMKSESRRHDRINFVHTDTSPSGCRFSHLTELSSEGATTTYEVDLDLKHLFDDQWNTSDTEGHTGYRVFDWVEYYSPHNKSNIWGHWLEVTDEMVAARDNTNVCRYCGAQYGTCHEGHLTAPRANPKFCKKCLGSPYLKESELWMLRLTPVSQKYSRPHDELSQEDLDWLKPRYVEAQLRGNEERREERLKKQRADLEKQQQLDDMKFDGMTRLLGADIELDNVIFHDHVPVFKFGWRNGLSPSVVEAMQLKLREIEFPHPTEFVISDAERL